MLPSLSVCGSSRFGHVYYIPEDPIIRGEYSFKSVLLFKYLRNYLILMYTELSSPPYERHSQDATFNQLRLVLAIKIYLLKIYLESLLPFMTMSYK